MRHNVHVHKHCTLTSFLPCLLSFSVCPPTDTTQLYNTQSVVVDTSLDFLHGSGAQFGETAGPLRQVHKGLSALESASVRDCVGRFQDADPRGICGRMPQVDSGLQNTAWLGGCSTSPRCGWPLWVSLTGWSALRSSNPTLPSPEGRTLSPSSIWRDHSHKILCLCVRAMEQQKRSLERRAGFGCIQLMFL